MMIIQHSTQHQPFTQSTRFMTITDGLRDSSCQLKSYHLPSLESHSRPMEWPTSLPISGLK